MFQELHRDCDHPRTKRCTNYNPIASMKAVANITSDVDMPCIVRGHHEPQTNQGLVQVFSTEMNTSHVQDILKHDEPSTRDPNTNIGSLDPIHIFIPMPQYSFHPQLVFQQHELDNISGKVDHISAPCESPLRSSNALSSIDNIHAGYGSFINAHNDVLQTPTPEIILSNFHSLHNTQVIGSKIGNEPLHITSYPHDDGFQKRTRSTPNLYTDEKTRKKKEAHNAIERRRRDLINDRISELSYLVPQCHEAMFRSFGTTTRNDLASMNNHSFSEINAPQAIPINMLNHVKLNKTFILEKSAEYIRQLQNVLYRQAMLLKASNINDKILDHAMAAVMPQCPSPYLDSESRERTGI